MLTQYKLLPCVEPQLGWKFPALMRWRWQCCQLVWGDVCGQNSVLPDADEQHAQSCASLSPPFSSGHIPGCKCKYINNIKTYLNQHPDVGLATLCHVQKYHHPAARQGSQGSLHALSGTDFIGIVLVGLKSPFPPFSISGVCFREESSLPLSLVPHCLGMFQVTFLKGTQGELGGFHEVFCLVLLIACSNIK